MKRALHAPVGDGGKIVLGANRLHGAEDLRVRPDRSVDKAMPREMADYQAAKPGGRRTVER